MQVFSSFSGPRGSLFGVEADEPFEGALADGAEGRCFVYLHAAFRRRAVDAFGAVASAFVDTHLRVDACGVGHGRRGDGRAFGEHVGPFRGKVLQRREVRLPRLGVGGIHRGVLVVVEIFVGQPAEAVPELVDDDGGKLRVVGRRERVEVVDAPAAIGLRVGQHDDVLIGQSGEQVVEAADVAGREVAVGVERVKVGADSRAPPHAFARDAHATVL